MPGNQQPLRLPKRHAADDSVEVSASDGERLVDAQSLLAAAITGVAAILLFSVLWVLLTRVTGRVFPWMTVVLGILLGRAIRHAGRGVDWRFPALAAALALAGALLANVIVAAANTAESMGTGTIEILRAVTAMTWPVFFQEVLTAADYIYAALGATLAAYFANRRLSRGEYRALRLYRERSDRH